MSTNHNADNGALVKLMILVYNYCVMNRMGLTKHNAMLSCAILSSATIFLLSGCGQSSDEILLDEYRSGMETFFEKVDDANETINSIEAGSEEASTELLNALDDLSEACSDMAELEVPDDFANLGDLPDEVSDYMKEAVDAYHRAYDGVYDGNFDESALSAADEYYERANIRIRKMLSILHGENTSEQ
ncbi:MAG: hypothetical protein K6C95_02295 [Lachnospiraceae bacterium]|nr:hypothetical protein [Lachnospiraceae bacterium]